MLATHQKTKRVEGPTIKEAILKFWEEWPSSTIYASVLIAHVRATVYPRRPFDGTILRKLRELRSEGRLNYKVIDNQKAIYCKIPVRREK